MVREHSVIEALHSIIRRVRWGPRDLGNLHVTVMERGNQTVRTFVHTETKAYTTGLWDYVNRLNEIGKI